MEVGSLRATIVKLEHAVRSVHPMAPAQAKSLSFILSATLLLGLSYSLVAPQMPIMTLPPAREMPAATGSPRIPP
jgi:hypothetical protein